MAESFEQHLIRFPLYPLRALIERKRSLSELKASEPEQAVFQAKTLIISDFSMVEEDSPYRQR